MASNLYWFYDILIIGIALIYFYIGAKRGLMRSVVLVSLTVVSLVLSWFASTVLSPVIYERFLREPAYNAVYKSVSAVRPSSMITQAVNNGGYGVELTEDETQSLIDELDGDFVSKAAEALKSNGASDSVEELESGIEATVVDRIVNMIAGGKVSDATLKEIFNEVSVTNDDFRSAMNIFVKNDTQGTVELIESRMISPAVKMLLKGGIWIISMFVLMIISRTVANLFRKLNNLPIIGPINSTLGAVLGTVESLAVIYLIAQVVRAVCFVTSNSLMFLNMQTISQTYIFRYFVNFNILSVFG